MQVNLSDKKGFAKWKIILTLRLIIWPYCHPLALLENECMSLGSFGAVVAEVPISCQWEACPF